jgi:hypothetical protein
MRFAFARRALLATAVLCLMAGAALAQTTYTCNLTGTSEVPANASPATGTATVVLNAAQTQLDVSVSFSGLTSAYTASHIHGPAPVGVNAAVKWGFVGLPAGWVFGPGSTSGTLSHFIATPVTATDVTNLNNGQFYVNIHSQNFPGGEIRGQLTISTVGTEPATWSAVKALF